MAVPPPLVQAEAAEESEETEPGDAAPEPVDDSLLDQRAVQGTIQSLLRSVPPPPKAEAKPPTPADFDTYHAE